MFECAITLINQFITLIPVLIFLWLVFDFLGAFFFGRS